VTRLAAALVLLSLIAVLAACGGGSSSETTLGGSSEPAGSGVNVAFQAEGKPVPGGVLNYAHNQPIETFLPWTPSSNGDVFADVLVYDGLVENTGDPSELEPAIAESWTISKDHLTYMFKLRPGVEFSDGTPVTAEDVKFSIDTVADPKLSPSYNGLFVNVKSVQVVDPVQVRVVLDKPTPALLYNLGISGAAIVPQKMVESMGMEAFGQAPVGAGPFMVEKYSPGQPDTVLAKNPHYWQADRPYLDKINYKFIPDDNARMLAVRGGSVDIAEAVPFSQLDAISSSPGVELFKQNQFSSDWLLINNFKAPFNDRKVRQALAYATPLDQIAEVVFHGSAEVAATGGLPTKYLDRSIEPLPNDPEKAKQLLKEAGEENLKLTIGITSGDSVGSQVATILQAAWKEAGIDLSIRQQDTASLVDNIINQNYDIANLTPNAITSDVAVDDEFAYYVAHSNVAGVPPWIGWDNAKARQLTEEASSTWSEAKRQQMFSEYQQLLRLEQPLIALVHVPNLYAVRDNVHGFLAAGTGWAILTETWLSE
jgi:peptide/nickel transport system substrate-binding protein